MDAFEQLAADVFWADGYWVRTGVKVALSREEKLQIGRHSAPRWEIDLVAYGARANELLALECKSYLDSGGVHAAHFEPGSRYAHRYKLFHDEVLKDTILGALKADFIARGLCPADVAVRLGLVHAHATAHNAARLVELFAARGWLLFGPEWLHRHLRRMAGESYENSAAAMVAKLLLRPAGEARAAKFVRSFSDVVVGEPRPKPHRIPR
jgi:hypothetical protein